MEVVQQNYDARNFKKSINRTFSLTPCENLAPKNYYYYKNGILQTPPPPPPFMYQSFPQFKNQPPLLPLPIPNLVQSYNHINNLPLNRGFSCPPINKKLNKNKKSKSTKKFQESSKSSTKPLGPDPKDLPKDVSLSLSSSSSLSTGKKEQLDAVSSRYVQKKDVATLNLLYVDIFKGNNNNNDKFSSCEVFTISPPPSSLPLPTFSLRPKLSCNVEAATAVSATGVDDGATNDLRRLLKL